MRKRLIAIISIMLMAVLMLGSMGTSAFAEDINYYEEDGVEEIELDLKSNAESRTTSIFAKMHETTSFELIDPITMGPLDPSIATASFENNSYGSVCTITFKKTGKVYAAHKFTTNDKPGATYWAYNIKAKTYTCPIKTLKLGKINLTKKLGHSHILTGKAFKGKVVFKAKSGWKLKEMYKYNTNDFKEGKPSKHIALKKGKSITLKKGETLTLVFKKGKKTMGLSYRAK